MSVFARRSSLRESLVKHMQRKSLFRIRINKLKGRYLFRAAVRLVLEYMEWITEEPVIEGMTDDIALNIRLAQQKKTERTVLNLQDRSVLLTSPNERSKADKDHIFNLLQKLHAFKKYPDSLRETLAGVVLYQYLPSGRTIVRQGRKAENLYFIMNGEVRVTKTVIDEWTEEKKEVDMGSMNPGDIFGEVALLHVIPRTATVVTKTSVDLLLVTREDFNAILRNALLEEWDVLRDALVHFNYFRSWDEETIRECCILSRLQDFQPNETVLGDGKGMVNYVHFVLDGECRLIEHILVREKRINGKIRYELYQDEDSRRTSRETHGSVKKTETVEKESKRTISQSSDTKKFSADRIESDVTHASVARPRPKVMDADRMSIVTTTLLDVVNEWLEITDVAAMLMRDPSVSSQQSYPTDVRTIFMQICIFYRGACFGLGEQMQNRRIVSITPVRCFLVPRYWLFEHNRANMWERVKLFLNSQYPTREQLFKKFIENRKWIKYKQDLVQDIIKNNCRSYNNTTIHDVPYSIRITNEIDPKM